MKPEIYNLTDLSSEYYSLIRGSILLFFVYHLIIYFFNKNKIYLYYSLYSFFMYLFLLSHVAIDELYLFYDFSAISFQIIAISFYYLFTRYITETQKSIPKWDKVLLKVIPTLWLIAIFFIIERFFIHPKTLENIFYFIFFAIIITSLITAVKLIRINKPQIKLFVFGSLTFLMMFLITLSIQFFKLELLFINHGFHRMFFLYTGVFIEFIVFAVLISYHYREMLEEQTRLDFAITKSKFEFSELKMRTLKSQLNPLFIFNTLNSVNNFILKSQVEEASDFITKFARFVRNVLNNSNQTTITLYEELTNLKTYISLEKIRTNHSFEYVEEIDSQINLATTKVPPLFLQPYVENAIWHGISQIKGEKKIRLEVTENHHLLCFKLIDNGIGYLKSIEQDKLNLHKISSGSTESAQFRLNGVFNQKNVTIHRKDRSIEGLSGTEIFISFPKIN